MEKKIENLVKFITEKEHRKNILLYLSWVLRDYEKRKKLGLSELLQQIKKDFPELNDNKKTDKVKWVFIEGIKDYSEWQTEDLRKIVQHTDVRKPDFTVEVQLNKSEIEKLLEVLQEEVPENFRIWEINEPKVDDFKEATKYYHKYKNLPDSLKKVKYKNEIYDLRKLELIATMLANKLDAPAIPYYFESGHFTKILESDQEFEIINEENNMNQANIINNIDKEALNKILYGPPGTGKTYKTIEMALKIIGEKEDLGNEINDILNKEKIDYTDREKLREKFKEFKEKGQIEFITFHQSYSYEDFIEGLKAETDDNGQINYKVKDGIFKIVTIKAKENFENSKKEETINIEQLVSDFADYIEDILLNNQKFNLKGNVLIESVNKNSDGDFISFTIGGSVTSKQRLAKEIIMRDLLNFIKGKIKTPDDIKPRYESKNKRHGNAIYYYALFEKIKEFYEGNKISYLKQSEDLKNYILIIDEINRGNISKIFGELITLIEEDKRIGEKEEAIVKLPYLNEEFGVPNNLYIIGTMNTADRSIALLDTALRRRFTFIEMMPDYSLLEDKKISLQENKEIDLSNLLKTMNKRIEYLYDRDHTIGHAYFLKIKSFEDLKFIFKNKIIPLLQEYFYDDWEKIRFILADNQVDNEDYQFIKIENIKIQELFGNNIPELIDEKRIFTINNEAFEQAESYIKIYNPNKIV
ncbi:AAA family ATPase [Deferribacter thermophilus]|uniref:McrB family protein n=1 Tax=Deferribacter thermophilus TaxID=53573 RepID=UPI003C15BE22